MVKHENGRGHTPGPWTALREGVEIRGSDTHSVVAGEHMAGVAEVYCAAEASTHGEPGVTRISESEGLANLYVIAAAPELLACAERSAAALRSAGVEPNAGSDNPLEWLLHETLAAISKARGEA